MRLAGRGPAPRICEIVFLVITSFHEPASYLAVDAVEGAIGKRDVPFVARPGVGGPPVAGGAPGAGAFENAAANAFGGEEAGLTGSQGDAGHAGRSIHAN